MKMLTQNSKIQIPSQSATTDSINFLESATNWAGYSLQIHLHQGDILKIRCDAIVNAANCSLKKGGGIDKQIQDRGGLAMQEELEQYQRGCDTGHCVVTEGHGIQHVRYVLHAVGPDLRQP